MHMRPITTLRFVEFQSKYNRDELGNKKRTLNVWLFKIRKTFFAEFDNKESEYSLLILSNQIYFQKYVFYGIVDFY